MTERARKLSRHGAFLVVTDDEVSCRSCGCVRHTKEGLQSLLGGPCRVDRWPKNKAKEYGRWVARCQRAGPPSGGGEPHEVAWDGEAGKWRCRLCRTSADKLWDLGPRCGEDGFPRAAKGGHS